MWYTKAELPLRLGIWYSATGLFTIFSGVINYAIGHIKGASASWKYMYAAFITSLACPNLISDSIGILLQEASQWPGRWWC